MVGPARLRRRRGRRARTARAPGGRPARPDHAGDVDGFAVVERLRSDPEIADVPIIVLTAKDMTRADRERLDGRISYLAQKGTFRQAELVELVGRNRPARRRRRDGPPGDPHRRGQPAQPEARARHPRPRSATGRSRPRTPRTASRLRTASGPRLILMDVQLPGMDGVEALGRLRADPAIAGIRGRGAHRVRHEGGPRRGSCPPASTATSRSPSTCASSRARSPRCWPAPDGVADMSESRPRSSSSTTCRRTCGCWRRCSRRAATRSLAAGSGARGAGAVASNSVDLVLLDIVMPEMDGYEVLPRAASRPGDRVPAGGDDHGERRPGEARGARGRRRRLHHQAVRPGRAARPRALPAAHQGVPRHDRARRRPSSRPGTGSSSSGSRSRSTQLERVGRLRRFLSPQLADLVVSSGDDSFLQSHRREITVVFCDLRGFTAFAETVEPEDVMQVLGEYHAALGDLIHRFEGTLERFTGDGLMVFFNDPLPCPDAPQRAVRMAVAMRAACRAARGRVAPSRPRPRLRHRHRPGSRHAGPDRVRGTLRLRRDRQRHQPGRAAV